MIELKNLSKIYKLRSGEVRALDDVNIKLPEKGMVFILGKSGSGKTTLLNVAGGLDNYSSGDIVVDGVSLANYSQRDYDEYRNRYIGFVFQDFNLIENFSAGENVNLALCLQSDKKDKGAAERTLETVGLSGYYDRKISELSGGQRQRVAIARALVKNPAIILADEPTGNLDSVTATEIFDILKTLSEERLVLVVSHDRESAEKYADRIIELKDGRILSDSNPQSESKRTVSDENAINVGNVSEKEKSKKKNVGGYMPFSATLKYAMSNLWAKKIRILASVVCFVLLLGLFNLAYGASDYDVYDRVYETLKEQNAPAYFDAWENQEKYMSRDFIDEVYGGEGVPLYEDHNFRYTANDYEGKETGYFNHDYCDTSRSMPIDETSFKKLGFDLVCGDLPKNRFQVCITNYIAENILHFGDEEYLSSEKITSIADLVGKPFLFNTDYSVSGIIDTHLPEKYDSLKSLTKEEDYVNSPLYNTFFGLVDRSYHVAVMCHSDYFDFIYYPLMHEFTYVNKDSFITYDVRLKTYRINMLESMFSDYVTVPPYVATEGVVVSSFNLRYFIKESGYGDLMTDYETDTLRDIITDCEIYADLYYSYNSRTGTSNYNYHKKFRVIGFYDHNNSWYDTIFITDGVVDDMYDNIYCVEGMLFDRENREKINAALQQTYMMKGNDSTLVFSNEESAVIEKEYQYSNRIKVIAGAATGLFVVIVVIMMLNYFFSTIKDKTAEIGVLRAIGVRQSNIAAIFAIEALIISLVAFLLSLPVCFGMADWLENAVAGSMVDLQPGYTVHFVMVGFKSGMITLALSIGVALVGSALPFVRLFRLKPMEIMRKK